MKNTVFLCLLAVVISPCGAAPLGVDAFEMISISADEASESEQAGVLYLKGQFLMQSSDWQLVSERATVFGSPNKPDRVILEGSPARFTVYRAENSKQDSIEAAARVVEYSRDGNKLRLSGNATLMLGKEVIRSTDIEYDISTNRYEAGGTDGVSIEVLPAGTVGLPPVGH